MTDYPKSEIHEAIELSDQHNLFFDFHKNRRRLVAPAFGLSYLRSLEPLMQECTKVLIRKLDEILAALESVPQKLAKLREELDLATAGNPKGTLPTYGQVRNLEYLTACINESMRLRTVAATGIPREVPKDTTMAGIFVPAGTTSLRLPREYFPQADQYIPERWIPEELPLPPVKEFTSYPFSAGTRNCVGKNFVMMEMRLMLAAIITQYDIMDVPGQRTEYVQFITTALATGSYVLEMNKRT
ncbi:hypothetical protein BG000_010406 [Podila horticola]|nr:hypothetical protein BG000_010406 [Podila horticola]